MSDGSSGGIGGVLFEAGKAVGNTVKNQAQQSANAVAGQLGAQKPLFGGPKQSTSGTFTPKSSGGLGGQMPKADPFGGGGNFGKMFEGLGAKPGFGAKQPPLPPTPQFSQADLDKMAAENSVKDQEEIAKRQAELQELKMKHKQLHDEVYYNDIKNAGQNLLAKDRKEKAEAEQQDDAQKQQNTQSNQLPELSQNMMGKNQQLEAPINVKQEQTKTEANRGTTG